MKSFATSTSGLWGISALLCLLSLPGCADQSELDRASDAMPEEADDFQGCPDITSLFEPGLQTSGKQLAIKLIGSTPAQPERYQNQWTVEIDAMDGSPAQDAQIVRGQTFMPIHGHDGRVEPQMTALAQPGQVQIDKLNFSMRGPWEVRFWLHSEQGDDYAVFKVCVAK